jgi:hypothetical protein
MLPRSTSLPSQRRPTTWLAIAGFLLLAGMSAHGGIDLTPSVNEYISEGIKYQKLIFRQDKQRIEYNPPLGWSIHGSAERVQLTPPKKTFAQAAIEAVPLAGPQALDEKTTNALEQQFVSSLPPGSQFVTVVSKEQNPVPVDRRPSLEVTATYQLMGEKFLKSAIFVNLPDTQLIFRLTARKDDFEALHREFKRSIFSWHWLEADQTVSASADTETSATAR